MTRIHQMYVYGSPHAPPHTNRCGVFEPERPACSPVRIARAPVNAVNLKCMHASAMPGALGEYHFTAVAKLGPEDGLIER